MPAGVFRNRLDPDVPLYRRLGSGVLVPTGLTPTLSIGGSDFAHGASFQVTGSGFGTKATAAPLKWDDCNGTNGDPLEPRGWIVANQLQQGDLVNTNLRGTPGETTVIRQRHGMDGGSDDVGLFGIGRDSSGDYIGLTAASAANETAGDLPTTLYFDYWMKMANALSSPADNFKILRHHRFADGGDNGGLAWASGSPTVEMQHYGSSEGSWQSVGSGVWSPDQLLGDFDDTWKHLQIETIWTTPGGLCAVWVDGALVSNLTNRNFTSRANWMFETQGLNDTGNPGQYIVYFDDIYIDSTRARVEIGDNATYTSCTHREVQIPTAWSDTAVTFTVNHGTLTGTVHIFVTDSSGTTQNVGSEVIS